VVRAARLEPESSSVAAAVKATCSVGLVEPALQRLRLVSVEPFSSRLVLLVRTGAVAATTVVRSLSRQASRQALVRQVLLLFKSVASPLG
jgi:hypothetical protein